MNTVDIIISIPLLYGLYKGFTRGLVVEIASLVGLILGIYGGIHFSEITAVYLSNYIDLTGSALQLTAFIVTFLMILGITHFLAKLLEKIVNLVAMKLINKIGGAAFGLLKMMLILSVVLILVEAIDQRIQFLPQNSKKASTLYRPIASIAPMLIPVFNDSGWYNKLEKTTEKMPSQTEIIKKIAD